MALEALQRLGSETARRQTGPLRQLVGEVLDQARDVPFALAQRRDVDRHDVEAVQQVFAEPALADLLVEALVGRGDDPHVDVDRLARPDARNDALLQRAQHLGLGREAHVSDLVEEQRAAVGLLELPGPVRRRAGKAPLQVPEQLAFDQLGGNGRAVDLDERAPPARAERVDRARHQLLARAVLAGDEHAGGRGGDLLDALDHFADRAARAHDLVLLFHLGAQPHVLCGEVHVLERIAQRQQDAVGVERLFEEIVGAELCGLDRRLDGAVPGNHHDHGLRVELPQSRQSLEPVHALHLDVEEDQQRAHLGIHLERLGPGGRRVDLEPFELEDLLQGLADPFLIVDDQNAAAHGRRRR